MSVFSPIFSSPIMPTAFCAASGLVIQPGSHTFTPDVPSFVSGGAQFQRSSICFIDSGDDSNSTGSTGALKIVRTDDVTEQDDRYFNTIIAETSEGPVKANSPDVLRSGGLGPCIAIGLYDPLTMSGYMIHDHHFSEADVIGFKRAVQADYVDLSRLHVVAIGAGYSTAIEDQEERAITEAMRSEVEQSINNFFAGAQIYIEWTPDDKGNELFLDTLTGTFGIDISTL